MRIFLSVIIPCYNESENLKRGVLEEVSDWLEKQRFEYEVIVSDDASTDESRDLVKEFVKEHKKFRLLENPHGGKAVALRYGLREAKGEWVLFTDMDQSTPISELGKMLKHGQEGYQVVIGSRGKERTDASMLRKVAARSFRLFRKSLMLRDIEDTQCGFKLASTKVARHLFESMGIFKENAHAKGWTVAAWDVEFLYLAEKYGYRIKEVAVKWNDRDESTSKDRSGKFVKESLDMARQLLRVRLNDFQGKYANSA